ncbi:MAG: DNA polymerase III, subunit gamma and tau [Bacteroidetes bacterium]|nr:MAG: DNA polymerase III, subunit gamma and tau [Bacteroidota bacterium]
MGSFVVSARKYRPETFDTVVGQQHITETLINEITNDRLAQAFLFCGPRGVGKTTCARILAREINKGSVPKDYDFSFNIFELDAASHNSVEDIRSLNEQVRIPPQTGNYKVYIIDEVHMLSSNAFNAFLKTLEEPPKYAVFILATTEKHKILPTILSRCQVFNFDRIQIPQIVSHLQSIAKDENIEAEETALHLIAQKADGAMRDALSIFDQMASFGSDGKISYAEVVENLNILDYDYYFKITDGFLSGDISSVLVLYDEIQKKGFDGQLFVNGLANHFRDLLVAQNANSQQLLEKSKEIAGQYNKQAQSVTSSFVINAINILGETDMNYKTSRNQRLHVELCLIKLASLQHAIDVTKKKSLD